MISLDHLTDFQVKMMYNVLDFIEQNREYKRQVLGIKKKPVYVPKNKVITEEVDKEVIETITEEVNETRNKDEE